MAMPKVDIDSAPDAGNSRYPGALAAPCSGRHVRRLGPHAGLGDFGVSHVVLDPGAWSSQRHWHEGIDEFVVMLDGTAVLVEETGRTVLRAGDCAAFPKDVANAHHLVNESDRPVVFLAFGRPGTVASCHYPDVDLLFTPERGFTRKDGSSF